MSREITALASWYGSDRMIAKDIGLLVGNRGWVGIPCCGGMSAARHIQASSLAINDKHHHVVNLGCVVADPELLPALQKRLMRLPFHPDVLRDAQDYCRNNKPTGTADLECAVQYFITSWMGRSGISGTKREFHGGISTRWTCSGGDSNIRYRSAMKALAVWHKVLLRASFTTLDIFDFLTSVKDLLTHALYVDPPFPETGDPYAYTFTPEQHTLLEAKLRSFTKTRIVVRYYDHPLITGIYSPKHWEYRELQGRDQHNTDDKPELLLVRN